MWDTLRVFEHKYEDDEDDYDDDDKDDDDDDEEEAEEDREHEPHSHLFPHIMMITTHNIDGEGAEKERLLLGELTPILQLMRNRMNERGYEDHVIVPVSAYLCTHLSTSIPSALSRYVSKSHQKRHPCPAQPQN